MNWRTSRKGPLLRGFTAVEVGGWCILVRPGLEGWAAEVVADRALTLGMMGGGRAAHPVVEVPGGGAALVRRFHRGGLMRHLNRDRYFLGHRAFDELRVTEVARGAGVRVPEPLAAAERPARPGYEALIATRLIPGARGLDEWLRGDPKGSDAELSLAGEQIGRMHAAGIAHPDLNLRNLLVAEQPGSDAGGEIYLLDFDRARLSGSPVHPYRRRRDLARLGRSARKLGLSFTVRQWEALRAGYGAEWPFPPGVSPPLR